MQHEGLRAAGQGGGAEREFAVVAGDEVQEVETNVFAGGIERQPAVGCFRVEEVAPDLVHQFDPKGNVAHHLAVQAQSLSETSFRIVVLPEFPTIVEKHPGQKEIGVQVRVDGEEGLG